MADSNESEHDFQPIGNQVTKIVASVKASDSSLAKSDRNSSTTGQRALTKVPSNVTGLPPGGTGAAVLPLIEALANGEPDAVDKALMASLPPALVRQLVPRYKETIDPVYGWDGELIGYEPKDGRFELDTMDRLKAESVLALACKRPEPGLIYRELARLNVLTKSRAELGGQADARVEAYAEEMANYPADCIVWACRKWTRMEKFFPAWSELKELLDRAAKRRFAIARLLR